MQDVAMREYMTEGHDELGMPSSPRKSRRKGRSHGGQNESRAALSSRGATSPPSSLHVTGSLNVPVHAYPRFMHFMLSLYTLSNSM